MNAPSTHAKSVRRFVIGGALLALLAVCAVGLHHAPLRDPMQSDFTIAVLYAFWGDARGLYVQPQSGGDGMFAPYGPVVSLYLTLQLPPLIY